MKSYLLGKVLEALESRLMSLLSEKIAAVGAAYDRKLEKFTRAAKESTTRIVALEEAGVVNTARIADLELQVKALEEAGPGATPEELQGLDDLAVRIDADEPAG